MLSTYEDPQHQLAMQCCKILTTATQLLLDNSDIRCANGRPLKSSAVQLGLSRDTRSHYNSATPDPLPLLRPLTETVTICFSEM